jgi:heme exporter protein C
MDSRMLWPLGVSALGISLGFGALLTANLRAAVMERRTRSLLMAQAERTA